MITLQEDNKNLLSLTEAAKRLPGRPHISTLARWAHGMKDGRRLETIKLGGKVFTSIEACQRFAASAGGATASVNSDAISEPRRNKLSQIDRQLDADGL